MTFLVSDDWTAFVQAQVSTAALQADFRFCPLSILWRDPVLSACGPLWIPRLDVGYLEVGDKDSTTPTTATGPIGVSVL
jgi:hypothetical protein